MALRRLKKKDLAENAGLSVSFVSDVTAGKGNPSLETIAAIANALEVPLVALLEPPPIGTDGWDASLADTLSKEDKKYLTTNFLAGKGLVKALEQRASTILKVAKEIIKKQEKFLDHGVNPLK